MTETGQQLETVRISNDPEYLRAAQEVFSLVDARAREGCTLIGSPGIFG